MLEKPLPLPGNLLIGLKSSSECGMLPSDSVADDQLCLADHFERFHVVSCQGGERGLLVLLLLAIIPNPVETGFGMITSILRWRSSRGRQRGGVQYHLSVCVPDLDTIVEGTITC